MNNLDMEIEAARKEMHELIEMCGMAAESVIKKSQELDILLVKKMCEGMNYGKILC